MNKLTLANKHTLINYVMICLGTWWKMWKELDALSVEQSGHKFFCSEVNNEGKNILSSTYEILVAFCFCSRITMISVNNLFFIFFDVKRTGEGQPAFLLDIISTTVEMEKCLFIPVSAAWALIKLEFLTVWKGDH